MVSARSVGHLTIQSLAASGAALHLGRSTFYIVGFFGGPPPAAEPGAVVVSAVGSLPQVCRRPRPTGKFIRILPLQFDYIPELPTQLWFPSDRRPQTLDVVCDYVRAVVDTNENMFHEGTRGILES